MTYPIIRSRRKTLAIHIKPNGAVEVRAPLRLQESYIEQFIAKKQQWINKTQAKIAATKAEARPLPPMQYAEGEFERAAHELLKKWQEYLGVEVTHLGFRAMKTRWGSCTVKTRRIRINTALARCPRECLEYVIVHELAHIIENSHSPFFWTIVREALPDFKTRKKQLTDVAPLLMG